MAWDGLSWAAFHGWVVEGSVTALHAGAASGLLYAAGSFSRLADMSDVRGVLAYNGTGWALLGGGTTDGRVYALHEAAGSVYVGGAFGTVGGVAAGALAVWDGRAWRGLGPVHGVVHSVAMLYNQLFVGGFFSSVSAAAAPNLARLSAGVWLPVADGALNGGVGALVSTRGCLVAAGAFTALDAAAAAAAPLALPGVARWCFNGTQLRLEVPGPPGVAAAGPVRALLALD